MESSICTVCSYSDFFLVCKLYSSDLQIVPVISNHLRYVASVYIGGL